MTSSLHTSSVAGSSVETFENVRKQELQEQTNKLTKRLQSCFYYNNNGITEFNAERTNKFGKTEDYFKAALDLAIKALEFVTIDTNHLSEKKK